MTHLQVPEAEGPVCHACEVWLSNESGNRPYAANRDHDADHDHIACEEH